MDRIKRVGEQAGRSFGVTLEWWDAYGLERDATWRKAVVLLSLLGLAHLFLTPLNHDVGWHLYAAGRLLGGDRLYVDLLEYNPPLIYLLNVPVVLLADFLGVSELWFFYAGLAGLILLCAATSWRILNRVTGSLSRSARRVLLLSLLFATMPLVKDDVGQREHLTLVLILPYLALLAGRAADKEFSFKTSLLCGLLGALGLALKPQFLFLGLVVEGYVWLVEQRKAPWRRPESLTVCLFFLFYGVGILFGWPQYLSMVRMAAGTYSSFDVSPGKTLALTFGLPILTLAAFLLARPAASTRELRRTLFLSLLAALMIAGSYLKGWCYHFYPSYALSTVLLTLIVATLAEAPPTDGRSARPYQAFTSLLITLALISLSSWQVKEDLGKKTVWEYSDEGRLTQLVGQRATGQSVVFFSSSIFPAFPVVNYTRAHWALRFPFLWPLPGLYPRGFEPRTPEEMGPGERFVMETVVSDFLTFKPVMVVTDERVRKQGFGERKFDYPKYFRQDPRFAKAWKDYEFDSIVGEYKVYRRREAAVR
ncbi:MAG: hypothetical protein ACE5JX_11975 [Acidobacteriota bacterium]